MVRLVLLTTHFSVKSSHISSVQLSKSRVTPVYALLSSSPHCLFMSKALAAICKSIIRDCPKQDKEVLKLFENVVMVKSVFGWVTGAVAEGCPLPPTVQRLRHKMADGGCGQVAARPGSHTRTH